jgi:methyl-accepting chemotaxis protein
MRWVFAFLMLCYLALGAIVVWQGYALGQERMRYQRNLEGIVLMSRFQRTLTRMQTFLEKYHILGEAVWMERFGVEKDMASGLVKSILQARGLPMSAEDRQKLSREWEEYLGLADSAFKAQDPKSQELYVMRASLRQEEMSLLSENTIHDILRHKTSVVLAAWVNLALAALIVALGLTAFLRMVVSPARRLAKEARRIAVGDLDGPVTLRAPGRLGEIAESLEELRMNLVETREQVKRLISRRPGAER